jgi:molybdate transport system substrate-binding protein
MSGLAVKLAFERHIIPHFERTSGYGLETLWLPTALIVSRIAAGERADVVIAIDGSLRELAEQGIVIAETCTPIAQALLGVAVKAGSNHPDISTAEAFIRVITSHKVAFSRGGASGIYFAQLIDRLGIAEDVKAKAVTIPAGFTAEKLVDGEADVAIQQIGELMMVSGVDVIGPFPEPFQVATDFSAGMFADAKNPEGAKALLAELCSENAAEAYHNGGLTPRFSNALQ